VYVGTGYNGGETKDEKEERRKGRKGEWKGRGKVPGRVSGVFPTKRVSTPSTILPLTLFHLY
jgi:hypothetical protein